MRDFFCTNLSRKISGFNLQRNTKTVCLSTWTIFFVWPRFTEMRIDCLKVNLPLARKTSPFHYFQASHARRATGGFGVNPSRRSHRRVFFFLYLSLFHIFHFSPRFILSFYLFFVIVRQTVDKALLDLFNDYIATTLLASRDSRIFVSAALLQRWLVSAYKYESLFRDLIFFLFFLFTKFVNDFSLHSFFCHNKFTFVVNKINLFIVLKLIFVVGIFLNFITVWKQWKVWIVLPNLEQ